jgi:hypothetical protein
MEQAVDAGDFKMVNAQRTGKGYFQNGGILHEVNAIKVSTWIMS